MLNEKEMIIIDKLLKELEKSPNEKEKVIVDKLLKELEKSPKFNFNSLPKQPKILKNALRCNHCNDIIESTHVHDFKYCQCGSIAIDGGKEYLKRCGNINGYTDLSIMEEDK